MKSIKVSNNLSHATTKLFPCREDNGVVTAKEVHATGFFWLVDDALYIITNWHNVTGRHPDDLHLLSDKAFVPNAIEFSVKTIESTDGQPDHGLIRNGTFSLYDREGQPTWFEHPIHGRSIDVVALPAVTLGGAKLLTVPVNTFSGYVDYEPTVGDDVFVLGYPLGLDDGNGLPIWKKGSIASEPKNDLGGLPKLLIDTATRKGMSGSPVIVRRTGLTLPRGSTGFGADSIFGTSDAFLGVYSNRVGDDTLGAQLGVVWKAKVVEEIIAGAKLGQPT